MLHIAATSPARDAGSDEYAGRFQDIDGQERTFGSGVDIGADEYVLPGAPGVPTELDLMDLSPRPLRIATPVPSPRVGSAPAEIRLTLPAAESVTITLLDVRGRVVARREAERLDAGETVVRWDPGTLPSGGYFLRVETNSGRKAMTPWIVVR